MRQRPFAHQTFRFLALGILLLQLATKVDAASPLLITGVQRQAEMINLTWNSQTGKVYAVEYSTDVKSWGEFVTNVAASAGTSTAANFSTADPLAGNDFVLLQYQMGQFGPQIQDAAKTASGGNLTPGAGLNYFSADFTGYTSSPALIANFVATNSDVATALSNDSVITFTLTVGTNVADLDLSSLSFNAARGGSSTPRGYAVYVTTPTSTNQLVQAAATVNTVRTNWSPQFVNLSGVSSLHNLTAGKVVRFTLPIFSPSPGSSLEMDDLTVRGAVSPRPVPAYVGAEQLYLRVRELPGAPILVQAATQPGGTWNSYATRTLDQLPSFLSGRAGWRHQHLWRIAFVIKPTPPVSFIR